MKASDQVSGGVGFCASAFLQAGGDVLLGLNFKPTAVERSVRSYLSHSGRDDLAYRSLRFKTFEKRLDDLQKLNKSVSLQSSQNLAEKVADKALIAGVQWRRPAAVSTWCCMLWADGEPIGQFTNLTKFAQELGMPYNGEFRLRQSQSTSSAPVLLLANLASDGAGFKNADLEALSVLHREGKLAGVLLFGWGGHYGQLDMHHIPYLITWGTAPCCAVAAKRFLAGTQKSSGVWPYRLGGATR